MIDFKKTSKLELKYIKGKGVIIMTKLSNEDQANYEHAIDMAETLVDKMGDTWGGSNIGDVIFSIGVAVDAICEDNDYPQELASEIIGNVLEDDTDTEVTENNDHIKTISLDSDDSLEFLKRLLSSKDND